MEIQNKIVYLGGGVTIEDHSLGAGAEVENGNKLTIAYKSYLQTESDLVVTNFAGDDFEFILGSGASIRGWDIGIAGMKVGGKRRIVCPPNTAFGEKGIPSIVPPNATIVFDIELKNST